MSNTLQMNKGFILSLIASAKYNVIKQNLKSLAPNITDNEILEFITDILPMKRPYPNMSFKKYIKAATDEDIIKAFFYKIKSMNYMLNSRDTIILIEKLKLVDEYAIDYLLCDCGYLETDRKKTKVLYNHFGHEFISSKISEAHYFRLYQDIHDEKEKEKEIFNLIASAKCIEDITNILNMEGYNVKKHGKSINKHIRSFNKKK